MTQAPAAPAPRTAATFCADIPPIAADGDAHGGRRFFQKIEAASRGRRVCSRLRKRAPPSRSPRRGLQHASPSSGEWTETPRSSASRRSAGLFSRTASGRWRRGRRRRSGRAPVPCSDEPLTAAPSARAASSAYSVSFRSFSAQYHVIRAAARNFRKPRDEVPRA